MIQRLLVLAGLIVFASSSMFAEGDPQWTSHVLWDAGEKIQGVLFGDVDVRRKGIEGIAVTQGGLVAIGGLEAGRPWSEIIYDHPAKLQAIVFQDIDPEIPGRELYVSGAGVSTPGQVLQIIRFKNAWRVRTVWEGSGFVHAMAKLDGLRGSDPARLIVAAYDGSVNRVTPRPEGLWSNEVIFRRPLTGDSSQIRFKDVAIGRFKGIKGRRIAMTALDGQVYLIDPDGKGGTETIHFEEKGVARITLAPDGTLYGACNNGNVLRFGVKKGKWSADTLYTDEAELRGVRMGTFRTTSGPARLAIYGYSGKLRALLERNGRTYEPTSLFVDEDKAHSIDMSDAVKGNGSDELLVGGYAGKLILVAHR